MKNAFLCLLLLTAACASAPQGAGRAEYKIQTIRQTPYYLSADAAKVQDTCPKQDILRQYSCGKDQADGFECFDVYMAQGSPVNDQRYTLLSQTVQNRTVSPQPPCPAAMEPDCEAFLRALNYNLEFSWYLVNFPTSSFEQCRETYDCKRIDCYIPASSGAGQNTEQSTLVSCVYKRNQVFFVGSQVTCRRAAR